VSQIRASWKRLPIARAYCQTALNVSAVTSSTTA